MSRKRRARPPTLIALAALAGAALLATVLLRLRLVPEPVARAVAAATGKPANLSPPLEPLSSTAAKIVAGAKAQIGDLYDPRYVALAYPNGDVARGRGACTDVVVRALRHAGYDLQRLIHKDMKEHFAVYPKKWGLRRPDPHIDHRRVPNQQVFFARHGRTLTKTVSSATRAQWQPGDIVTWKLDSGLDHTGVLSDRVGADGVPLVIHNLSQCAEEDCLTRWKVTGHFRYPRGPAAGR